jgi:FlaA1/EpsC-like NDP-sugar epimerase
MGINGFSAEFSSQTAYEQTDTHTGYAIRMVFQKNKGDEQYSLKSDRITRSSVIKYITSSHEVENRIHKTVDKLVDNQTPLIVWGVGTHTQRLLATSRLISAKIVAYVDSNPNYQNKLLNGIPIMSPDSLVGKSEPILVSSRIFQDEIVRQIRFELNLKNEIYTLYEG